MTGTSRPRSRETLLIILSRRVHDLRTTLAEVRYVAGTSAARCSSCQYVHGLLARDLDRPSELHRLKPKNDS